MQATGRLTQNAISYLFSMVCFVVVLFKSHIMVWLPFYLNPMFSAISKSDRLSERWRHWSDNNKSNFLLKEQSEHTGAELMSPLVSPVVTRCMNKADEARLRVRQTLIKNTHTHKEEKPCFGKQPGTSISHALHSWFCTKCPDWVISNPGRLCSLSLYLSISLSLYISVSIWHLFIWKLILFDFMEAACG